MALLATKGDKDARRLRPDRRSSAFISGQCRNFMAADEHRCTPMRFSGASSKEPLGRAMPPGHAASDCQALVHERRKLQNGG